MPLKRLLSKNINKLFIRPLYRIIFILLGLPANIAALFIFVSRKRRNEYSAIKAQIEQDIRSSPRAKELEETVRRQIRNKAEFFGKPLSGDAFEKEVAGVFNERLSALTEEEAARKGGGKSVKTTYLGVLNSLLENTGFLLFFIIVSFPAFVLTLIYSNAYAKYIMERLFMMVFVIFGVTFLVFTILYMAPMDAATNILGPSATREQIESFDKTYGLDKPYGEQLFEKFKMLITFDLGRTYTGNEDVAVAISNKFPVTLEIAFYSLLLAVIISIPSGIISAIRPNTILDYVFMLLALLGLSIPNFWLGLMLINYLSIQNAIFPAIYNPDNWRSIVLPAIVLGTSMSASTTRMTRSSLLEVINQDYIVTAKAKGLSGGRVIMRHALTNAMIPIVTVVGLQFGSMLGGAAVTEKVFNINGIGKYIVDKQFIPDIPAVLAGVVYTAIVISFANLFVDILYTFLDPRIKSKLKSY